MFAQQLKKCAEALLLSIFSVVEGTPVVTKADINQTVRHKSLICVSENPVLQDFQSITALWAVIGYVLIINHFSLYFNRILCILILILQKTAAVFTAAADMFN